jgi:hypothetical protein
MKDVQATEEARCSLLRASALKREHPALQFQDNIYQLFFIFLGHFSPLGCGSGLRIRIQILIQGPFLIRIRIHNTDLYASTEYDPSRA